MSQKLRDLIRAVRACKTAAEERGVIAKEVREAGLLAGARRRLWGELRAPPLLLPVKRLFRPTRPGISRSRRPPRRSLRAPRSDAPSAALAVGADSHGLQGRRRGQRPGGRHRRRCVGWSERHQPHRRGPAVRRPARGGGSGGSSCDGPPLPPFFRPPAQPRPSARPLHLPARPPTRPPARPPHAARATWRSCSSSQSSATRRTLARWRRSSCSPRRASRTSAWATSRWACSSTRSTRC